MKELIPMDEHGLFCDTKDTARVDSRYVAKEFEKSHKNVLRAIENIISPDSGLSKDFVRLNFALNKYQDEYNRSHPCYALTRDGFTMLVMGFTGRKAMQFKEAYIKRFNAMEQSIQTLAETRQEFPLLTEHIRLLYENPQPYHYSNEADMLNRVVIGQTSKQFREAHGLPKGESIRPYLKPEQIELLDIVQKIDVGLLVSVPDYQMRKRHLEWYLEKKKAA